jgi:CheY-like chemotaxis protein
MPIMDGLEATRRIRSFESERSYIESGKGKQLIFGVSANGADDIKEEALASGMDSFVPKPFSIDYLMEFQMNHYSCRSYDGDVDTAGDEQV